jgi:hypothetical protein
MANTNLAEILKWSVTSGSICASNDTGSVVVTNTGTNFFDVSLDNNGNIYTCAFVTVNDDPSPRVFRYHPNGTLPLTNSEWAVGDSNDTYAGASGLAVDPTGTYVAVAFQGPAGLFSTNGNTKVLWATNGSVAANLDLVDRPRGSRITPLDSPVNIHLTGCPNSCAQHYIGDIGLIAARVAVNDDGDTVDGYHVLVGGGFGPDARLARDLYKEVKAEDAPHTIERILKGYLAHREGNETFLAFSQRHDVAALQAMFDGVAE